MILGLMPPFPTLPALFPSFPLLPRRQVVYVQTPTGPSGLAGPLRIDLQGKHCSSPLQAGT